MTWSVPTNIKQAVPDGSRLYTTCKMGIYEIYGNNTGNTRTWHFDLPVTAWHQPQKSIAALIQPSCAVLCVTNTNCDVRNRKKNRIYMKYIFFNILSQILKTFHGIQHSIANLWEFCVSSNIKHKHLSRQWSLRCSWSIACRGCSNYIFILDFTPGFNGLKVEASAKCFVIGIVKNLRPVDE